MSTDSPQARTPRNPARGLTQLLAVAALAAAGAGALARAATTPDGELFRVGFSAEMFMRVNESDARASLSAFASVLAKERGVPTARDHAIYDSTTTMAEALRRREVDAIGLSVPELWILDRDFDFAEFIVDASDDELYETYLLVVRRGAGLTQLSELRGKSYTTVTSVRLSMASVWLDLLLADAGQPPVADFFGRPVGHAKPNKAVLPLFFGDADVCLVTRRMLAALTELNPQIAAKLDVIASSPPLMPSVFAYHAGGDAAVRASTAPELVKLHESAAGRQILTILQSQRIDRRPRDVLDPTFRMLEDHAQRLPASSAALEARLREPRKIQ